MIKKENKMKIKIKKKVINNVIQVVIGHFYNKTFFSIFKFYL